MIRLSATVQGVSERDHTHPGGMTATSRRQHPLVDHREDDAGQKQHDADQGNQDEGRSIPESQSPDEAKECQEQAECAEKGTQAAERAETVCKQGILLSQNTGIGIEDAVR